MKANVLKGKRIIFYVFCLSLFFSGYRLMAQSEILVNEKWDVNYGLPEDIELGASVVDNYGNLIVVGHTKSGSQHYNILVTKYSKNGQLLWENEFNYANNSKDFGTCITTNADNEIFVGGACFVAQGGQLLNFILIKYDANGNQIFATNTDGGHKIDVAFAIVLDEQGNILLTGASASMPDLSDFMTVLYDPDGVELWQKHYDYINLNDVPTAINIDSPGKFIISGLSASSVTGNGGNSPSYDEQKHDLFSIPYDYDINSATEGQGKRISSTELGFDNVVEMKQDGLGNYYLVGQEKTNGQGYNSKAMKLDPSLNIVYEKTIDFNTLDNKINSIEVNDNGKLYATGYTKNPLGNKQLLLMELDNQGNEIISKEWEIVNEPDGSVEGRKVKLDNQGNIYVTSERNRAGVKELVTTRFDQNGKKVWEMKFAPGTENKAMDVEIANESEIYVTGKTLNSTEYQYTTVKYEQLEKPLTYVYEDGKPSYVANEIIVRFDRSALNLGAIDKVGLNYGSASEFLTQETIEQMIAVQPKGFEIRNCTFIKIHKELTTAHTVSISRLGSHVEIPEAWASLRISGDFSNTTEAEVCAAFKTLHPTIKWASHNRVTVVEAAPNDPEYANNQPALHPVAGFNPNCHINVEDAWDTEMGQEFIRVGIFDTGVNWNHHDLFSGLPSGENAVIGGKNYLSSSNTPILSDPANDDNGHGTKALGIIGAIRANGLGIAGIAGGDIINGQRGVSLFPCKIGDAEGHITAANACAAIIEGACSPSGSYGFGLHVMSNSWSFAMTWPCAWEDRADLADLREAVRFANQNGVVVVASRGNEGNSEPAYPATFWDDWAVSVGASGTDGEYVDGTNGDGWWSSSFGRNVDLTAPGVKEINRTLSHTNDVGYIDFNGTSAAAPHVAGVASLILSNWNDPNPTSTNLTTEDVSNIMEFWAADRGNAGYDQLNGWGLVDATAALAGVQRPRYNVVHHGGQMTFYWADPGTPVETGFIHIHEDWDGIIDDTYYMEVYEVTQTISHTLGENEILLDAWSRTSASGPCWSAPIYYDQYVDFVDVGTNVELIAFDENSATLRGYIYHIVNDASTGEVIDRWVPIDAGTIFFSYSLYVEDVTASIGEIKDQNIGMQAYPNPANENVQILYYISQNSDVTLTLYDMNGSLVKSIYSGTQTEGTYTVNQSLSDISQGIYLLEMRTEYGIVNKKLVITD